MTTGWKMSEVIRARRLRAEGLSLREVARLLSRSVRQLRRHLLRHGDPGPEDAAACAVARGQSRRSRALCEALGWPEVTRPLDARVLAALSRGPLTLHALARALGWSHNGRGGRPSERLRLRLRMLEGGRYVVRLPGRPPRYAVAPRLLARKGELG